MTDIQTWEIGLKKQQKKLGNNLFENSAEKIAVGSEGVAEGGFGGNSATPERNQIVDSPAVLLVQSRTPQNSFLFLLKEKNRRAQIKKCEENFFAGWRSASWRTSDGGAGFLIGGFAQKMFELRPKNTAILR